MKGRGSQFRGCLGLLLALVCWATPAQQGAADPAARESTANEATASESAAKAPAAKVPTPNVPTPNGPTPNGPAGTEVVSTEASGSGQRGRFYAKDIERLQAQVRDTEASRGPAHPDLAASLSALGAAYVQQGLFSDAEPVLVRALAIYEQNFGPEHPYIATALNNLARIRKELAQYPQAEALYQRALSSYEKAYGPEHTAVVSGLLNLAALYEQVGQYDRAESLFRRAIEIAEKTEGPDGLKLAVLLSRLAHLLDRKGQYAAVEALYLRALEIRQKALKPDHPVVADSWNNLAMFYYTQGQYKRAEALYRQALDIRERALGPDHPTVAANLYNLGALFYTQGQFDTAGTLYRRALAIREKTYGPLHPSVALSLNALGSVDRRAGRAQDSERAFLRALAIYEQVSGPDHPETASVLNNLALLEVTQGKYAQAGEHARRALVIREKAYGPAYPGLAPVLGTLASAYAAQGEQTLAQSLQARALSLREASLPADHPSIAISMNALARTLDAQGDYPQALQYARKGTGIFRQRVVARGSEEGALRESGRNRSGFQTHLSLLERNPDAEPALAIANEALQVAQLQQTSGTEAAVAKMALRFAAGDDALAGLVKRRQDAVDRLGRVQAQQLVASARAAQDRNAALDQGLRDAAAAATDDISAIDRELGAAFPQYQELTRPEPLGIEQIQALLRPGEAMVAYASTEKTYLWVVTRSTAKFIPLSISTRDLASAVSAIRARMDFDDAGQPLPVDVGALHRLYEAIFAPAQPYLADVKHILFVPSGPLQSLPPAMLAVSAPPGGDSAVDYRKVDWLINHYAFSILPGVSSIRAFRQFANHREASEPFAGFGDPLIGDGAVTVRGRKALPDMSTAFRTVGAAPAESVIGPNATLSEIGIADVEMIRDAPRLKETADELRAMAQVLGAGSETLWLQGSATESRAKQADLSRYRTIAFATHGVMAGEIDGVGEPGLILTPPAVGTVEDDGYLSAGEIAKLRLNADWVILSACNTAAADGTPGAEGLSGLAKAFFYAGAGSLLVSHWPVASEATVPLTTGMLRAYARNPAGGKAAAQREAMQALMRTPDHPEYAHPVFWAPFVVVGEGG